MATIAATTGEVTIEGGGKTIITATKAGNSDYNEATARYILTITKVEQAAFAFASDMVAKTFGDTTFTFTPTGGSGTGAITWESSDPAVATISATSGEVTIVGDGTTTITTITATKAADTTYNAATASYTLSVKASQAAFTFASAPLVDRVFRRPILYFNLLSDGGSGDTERLPGRIQQIPTSRHHCRHHRRSDHRRYRHDHHHRHQSRRFRVFILARLTARYTLIHRQRQRLLLPPGK